MNSYFHCYVPLLSSLQKCGALCGVIGAYCVKNRLLCQRSYPKQKLLKEELLFILAVQVHMPMADLPFMLIHL